VKPVLSKIEKAGIRKTNILFIDIERSEWRNEKKVVKYGL
jgi:hypothetical protein